MDNGFFAFILGCIGIFIIVFIIALFIPDQPRIETTYTTMPNGEVIKTVKEKSPKSYKSHTSWLLPMMIMNSGRCRH